MGKSARTYLLLGLTSLVWASSAVMATELTLAVEQDRVDLTQSLNVEVSVLAAPSGTSEPDLALNGNFRIIDRTRTQSVSFMAGRTTEDLRYRYTLQPLRVGVFDIGPAVVHSDAGDLYSEARRVWVSGARRAAATAADGTVDFEEIDRVAAVAPPILVARVEPPEVFVGQRVVYTMHLLARNAIRGATPQSEPRLAGFWADPQVVSRSPRPERTQYGGKSWDGYLLRRSHLYPTSAGEIEIEPAAWDVTIVPPGFTAGSGQHVPASSEPVMVRVLALPDAGRPGLFSGLVGSVLIQATIVEKESYLGDGVTLRVTLRGDANLAAATAPQLPDLAAFRVYPGRPVAAQQPAEGEPSERTWEIELVCMAAGEQRIPALEYSYFDPKHRRYSTTRTEPISLLVNPRAATDVVPTADLTELPDLPEPGRSESVSGDIAPLKRRPRPTSAVPLYRHALVRWSLLWPVLLVLSGSATAAWRRRAPVDAQVRRRQLALRVALRRLDTAGRLGRDPSRRDAIPSEVAAAMCGYVADFFSESHLGLTRERMRELLGPIAEVDGLFQTLERIDYVQFTPAAASEAELGRMLKGARTRLKALDQALRRESS